MSDPSTIAVPTLPAAPQAPVIDSIVIDSFVNGYFAIADPASPSFGWSLAGNVAVERGAAVLREHATLMSGLSQGFAIPVDASLLSFTLTAVHLLDNGGGPGDAFEVALLDAAGLPTLAGTAPLSNTDALLNIQSGGRVYASDKVTVAGLADRNGGLLDLGAPVTVTIDLRGLAAGAQATLAFDLLGLGALSSSVAVDDVRIVTGPLNAAPVAVADSFEFDEDTAGHLLNLLANDSDAEGGALSPALVAGSGPAHGTLVANPDGSFSYTPNADFSGTDRFDYTVSDGELRSAPATVTLTVRPLNDAPVAVADAVSTAEDAAALLDPLANDVDVDGDALTPTVVTGPAHGTLTPAAGGRFTYAPAANYNGSDSFTYTVSDGELISAPATFAITVTPVNDAPVAANGTATTARDTALTATLPGASDVDGDTVTYAKTGNPSHGSVTVGAAGAYTYTPATGYVGSDSFGFTVSDGKGGSNAYTLGITVNAETPGIVINGTAGNDTLTGTPGNDTVNGLGGNDVLAGLGGSDTIDGGPGIDIAYYAAPRSSATIVLGATVPPHSATVSVPGLGTDRLTNVERLHFTDLSVAFDVTPTGNIEDTITKGIGGNGGKAYRLYQAALARTPDLPGLGYWISVVDDGAKLFDIASGFLDSTEFKDKYGANPTNQEYIRALYLNVLHREPDANGYGYWNALLSGQPWNGLDYGSTTRQQMLVDFSESAENKDYLIGVIGNGFDYLPWGG